MQKRGKRHDYFTSCLPWPQKGDAVDLPLGTSAYVKVDDITGHNSGINNQYVIGVEGGDGLGRWQGSPTLDTIGTSANNSNHFNLYADLTNATAATINQLREAFQIQKLYERDAREVHVTQKLFVLILVLHLLTHVCNVQSI